ncbi:RPC7L polymerase, partial [Jacana jacana]|nr:RPC7L polymerase [Jacana jacana]
AMAGRGRGRGRGQMTFNVEAVGIGKGDALPPPTLQPSPLFPVSSECSPPHPLLSPPYAPTWGGVVVGGVMLPSGPPSVTGTTIIIPKCKQRVALDKEETIKKLESLEKKEEEVTSEEEEEKEEEEEGKEEEEEEYDEEEHEEETDYIMSYFDNGEDFGADSDDNMDEAVY